MLSPNVERILNQRYYRPGENWDMLVERVVQAVCADESSEYKDDARFYIGNRIFLPNSPCLVNAGGKSNGLFACVKEGYRVNTINGLEKIEDVRVGTIIPTHFGETEVSKSWHNGRKNVLKIETEKGYRLEVTGDHQVYSDGKWIRADELELGNTLTINISEKPFGNNQEIDADLAYFIAYMKCDGYIGQPSSATSLICEIITDDEFVHKCLSKYFDNPNIIPIVDDGHIVRMRGYGEKYRWIQQYGDFGTYTCNVPEQIFQSPKQVVANFIAATFDAEGTVSVKKVKGKEFYNAIISISMCSEQYIRDIQTLLLQFGIISSVYKINDTRENRADIWRLCITHKSDVRKFWDEIGSRNESKANKLRFFYSVSTPAKRSKEDFVITSIENIGEYNVYDISTLNETFMAQSFVVHNCFVMGPTEDTLEDGFGTLSDIAKIAKSGGGCGFTGSIMRPKNSPVAGSAHGYSYGPNRFAEMISFAMDMMTQSGFRKMALMYTLDVNHKDIDEFISIKQTANEAALYNFNQSVFMDDAYINRAINNPSGSEARLLEKIALHAWQNGEPGILFGDTINNNTPYKYTGQKIYATNPSLRKGTRIITDIGYLPIEELDGKTFKVPNLYGKWSDAECFLSGHDKPLYEIVLSGGVTYHATAEHKWAVIKDGEYIKKATIDLKSGDKLPVNYTKKKFGNIGSRDDGFVVGWLYGDGWVTERKDDGTLQYGFIVSDMDAVNGVKEKLDDFIDTYAPNANFSRRQSPSGKYWSEINLNNKNVNQFFEQFGVNNKRMGVPECLWNDASEEFVTGFLDGLISSDGHVDKKGKRITITTAHHSFAHDLLQILGAVGIHAGMRRSESNGYARYDITFSPEDIDFDITHDYKNDRIVKNKWINEKYRKVISVTRTEYREDVWDISVYDSTHCFALSNVITGNCGEQPLPPYGSCNLGSINIAHEYFYERTGAFDYERLEKVTRFATRFLDNVGTKNVFPTEKLGEWYAENRPIGLGIMGLADAMLRLEIKYGSAMGEMFTGLIMQEIQVVSYNESERLGRERGVPVNCRKVGDSTGSYRRNITTVSIAPTGSIAFIAECSHGIEPIFSPSYIRIDERGEEYLFVHPLKDKPYFVAAVGHPNSPTWKEQIDIVSVVQQYCDSGISKTINMDESVTPKEIFDAYIYAWKTKCKGITVYRNNSRQMQVLNHKEEVKEPVSDVEPMKEILTAEDTIDSSCPTGVCKL